jgi:short-subunit dehydrogenase
MENAFGQPQTVVVLGGSSDIARAISVKLAEQRARTFVLAGRSQSLLNAAVAEVTDAGATTTASVLFDAEDLPSVQATIDECFAAVGLPVDLVIIAVGLLGEQKKIENDPAEAAKMAVVNYAWPVAALAAIREKLVRQGSGKVLVISSVAAIRVRRSSYLYSGAKAGLDRLCDGLADSLLGTGASLQILRPGFVHSKMTEGLSPAPFAVTVDRVASDTVKGLGSTQRVITSPGILKYVFVVLRHLPAFLWRKLDEAQ